MNIQKMSRKSLVLHEVIANGKIRETPFSVQLPTPSNGLIIKFGRDRYFIPLEELVFAAYDYALKLQNSDLDDDDIEEEVYKNLGI